MKKATLLFVLILTFGFACSAFAGYKISYLYVQHRVYEDGRNVNRLYFQIQDDAGNFVRDDLVSAIKLINPNGKRLRLLETNFYAHDLGMWAGYDGNIGQWIYDGIVHDESGYSSAIDIKRLIPGTYKFIVVYNNVRCKTTYNLNAIVKLPIIRSSKIKPFLDNNGNLFCTWSVPRSVFYMTDGNPSLQVSARALIDVYRAGQNIGYIQTRVPIHMNQVFFPARIIDQLKSSGGDQYRFRIQLRTNDNGNRSYSNYVDLVL